MSRTIESPEFEATITDSPGNSSHARSSTSMAPFPPLNPSNVIIINHVNPPSQKRKGRRRIFNHEHLPTQQPAGPSIAQSGAHVQHPLITSVPPMRGMAASMAMKRRGPSESSELDEASDSSKAALIPHILLIQEGEDITEKIETFCPNEHKAICVLSAMGVISYAALSQAATSEITSVYKGHLNILSLSGSYVERKVNGQKTRVGILSVALIDANGKVFGGRVTGSLIAASPTQVILGTFVPGDEHSE